MCSRTTTVEEEGKKMPDKDESLKQWRRRRLTGEEVEGEERELQAGSMGCEAGGQALSVDTNE